MNAITKPAPKSKLKAVAPKAAAPSKPKILVFGKPGVGKTWAAVTWPTPYFIDTEGGANLPHYTDRLEKAGGVYFGPDQGSLDFETVIGQVQALATEEHPYRTLVIDSISKMFQTAITLEAERLGDKNAFGADKKQAISLMRRLIAWLNRLDMNVILIAHEMAEWGLNNKGQREQIGATFDAWDRTAYELHLCLHILKEGNSRYAQVRKTRLLGFPDNERFPWTYEEFAGRYGRDVMENAAVSIQLAATADVAEIERLLTVVKMPDGWTEKMLTKAQAATFAEMSVDHASKVLELLNDKLKGVEV